MRIVDAMNTHNSSLITLKEIGFDVTVLPSDDPYEIGLWQAVDRAKKVELIAGDPLSLLGLATLWLHRGQNWRNDDDEDLYDQIIESSYP